MTEQQADELIKVIGQLALVISLLGLSLVIAIVGSAVIRVISGKN